MVVEERSMLVAVTGGSRGIGRQIVSSLAEAGFDIEFTYRNSVDEAEVLLGELRSNWPDQEFSSRHLDLVDRVQVDEFAERLSDTDTLYGLVHNAGQSCDALAATIDQDEAEKAMQVNFWSLTRLVTGAIRPMMRARSGRIVGIGSMAALHAMPGNSVYAATKGAMLSYLRTVAVELARKGITANFIAPGFVDTDMMSAYADHRDQMEKQIPAGRFAMPFEVAALVGHIMSPAAKYITGSTLPIDGGMSAGMTRHG